MALFGGSRDFAFIKMINDEYVKKIGEQTVAYIKASLENMSPNIYGESPIKIYNEPILIQCLVNASPQTPTSETKLSSVSRNVTFGFIKQHLIEINLVAEKGDIILWNNDYYEVFNIVENDLFFGKDPDYSMSSTTENFGGSISLRLETFYKNPESLPFKIERI